MDRLSYGWPKVDKAISNFFDSFSGKIRIYFQVKAFFFLNLLFLLAEILFASEAGGRKVDNPNFKICTSRNFDFTFWTKPNFKISASSLLDFTPKVNLPTV